MRVEIPNTIAVTLHGLVSRGVKAAEVTDEGHLVLTLTDGSRADLGSVLGPQGARGEQGLPGPKGETGTQGQTGAGFTIRGFFATAEALAAGVDAPEAGDAYGVGAAAPYDIYIYDGAVGAWVNNGPLQGAKGADGVDGIDGVTPVIGANGNWYLGETDTGKPARG